MWKWPENTIFDGNWRGVVTPGGDIVWHQAHYPDQWDSETREYWGVTWEEPAPVEEPLGPNYSIPKAVWLARIQPEEMERFYSLLASGNSLAAQIMTGMLAWTEIDVDQPETAGMLHALAGEGFFGAQASPEHVTARIEALLTPMHP